MKLVVTILIWTLSQSAYSQDNTLLKVHFLYGSKPRKAYRDTERKWFGGKLGGHVGIEYEDGLILSFMRKGKIHLFPRKKDKHSHYGKHTHDAFYGLFGSDPGNVKKAVLTIPITQSQKKKCDSIANVYLKHTPYDYAFFGMRCAAAAYEILGQVNIVPCLRSGAVVRRIFYPRRLRTILFRQASQNGWRIETGNGSIKRIWEADKLKSSPHNAR